MNRWITTCTVLLLTAFGIVRAQDVEWVQHLVAGTSNFANGTYADKDGNYYLTGYFGGPLQFGSQTLNGAGAGDIFIAKYNSSRGLKWVRQGTSSGWNGGRGIAVDGDGNVFVTGRFQMQAMFDGIQVNAVGDNDMFLAKYSADGQIQWVKSAGGGSADWGTGVSVDAAGNSYITGYYTGSAGFGGQTLGAAGAEDIFIASYSPSGELRWVKSGGGAGTDLGFGVSSDPLGGVYIVGTFTSSATFSGQTITGSASGAGFLAKYAENGDLEWVKALDGTSYAEKVSLDGEGNPYVVGMFEGNISFGGTALSSAGAEDIYVAKFDPDGTPLNAWSIGGTGSDGVAGFGQSTAVVAREDGGFFVAGSFENTVDLGETSLQSLGEKDILIARFDKDGNPVWAESGGGTEFEGFVSLGVDPADNAYLFGNFFSQTFRIGTNQLPRFGGFADMFVAKFTGSGGGGDLPAAKVNTDPIEFGDIPVGSSDTQFLVVDKGSPATLTVKDVYFKDGGIPGLSITEPTPDMFPTDLTGTQRLFITIEFAPEEIGEKNGTIVLETNDPQLPTIEVAVTGNGTDPGSLPTARFSTTELQIGNVALGTERTGSFTISPANAAGLVVKGLEFEDPDSFFDGFDIVAPQNFPVELGAGQSLEVVISFTPEEFGEANARLVVETSDEAQPYTNVDVSANATEAPVAQFDAFALEFDEVTLGERSEKSFTITSGSTGTLELAGVAFTGEGADRFRVTGPTEFPVVLDEGQRITMKVEFIPTEEKTAEAVLHVQTNDPLLPVGSVNLSGKGKSTSGVKSKKSSKADLAVQVTPNPVRNVGEVLLNIPQRGHMNVEFVEIGGGRSVKVFNGMHEGGTKVLMLDVSECEAGTYICMVEVDGKRYHRVVTVLK